MSTTNQPSPALISAVTRVLRPFVRFLLARGITLPFVTQLLKQLYVEVAERDFALEDKPQTDSRISMLTGVHRKDVRRLRDQEAIAGETPNAVSLGAQVINNWLTERRYLDKGGRPKELPIRGSNARATSFESLVASVSRQDLRPRVVLDELLRLQIVSVNDDRVSLTQEAFVPAQGEKEKLHYFGQNLRDHIEAATANIQAERPKFLERAVTYHGLTADDVAELQELAKESASESLKEVNRRAKQLKKRSENKPDNDQRISYGSFFFTGSAKDEQ